jgi:hypothetical protein
MAVLVLKNLIIVKKEILQEMRLQFVSKQPTLSKAN